jgi:Bacterial type II/III secretion system short domain
MRRVLPILTVLLMGFAPVPPYRPRPEKPVALPLVVMDVKVAAVLVQKEFGQRASVTFDVRTNTLFLKGQQRDIDRIVQFVRERDEAKW